MTDWVVKTKVIDHVENRHVSALSKVFDDSYLGKDNLLKLFRYRRYHYILFGSLYPSGDGFINIAPYQPTWLEEKFTFWREDFKIGFFSCNLKANSYKPYPYPEDFLECILSAHKSKIIDITYETERGISFTLDGIEYFFCFEPKNWKTGFSSEVVCEIDDRLVTKVDIKSTKVTSANYPLILSET